jgi:hypothetical protein
MAAYFSRSSSPGCGIWASASCLSLKASQLGSRLKGAAALRALVGSPGLFCVSRQPLVSRVLVAGAGSGGGGQWLHAKCRLPGVQSELAEDCAAEAVGMAAARAFSRAARTPRPSWEGAPCAARE